ncbi:NYN domain-containing protein [Pseudarthrobacter oxydans]|uniref:NYN domain-containing protein n=1 Tax=Pseudarthrobacter oxydans TaxID=1671 RepID=UPI003D2A9D14
MSKPTANLYIDGFNLYRRLLQRHPQDKWLDLEALAEYVLPDYEINRVRYFTAIIKPLPGADPQSPQRQQAYLRALATLPRTSVHLGKFRIDPRIMPVHPTEFDSDGNPVTAKVKKTEEKGSDVALASYLLLDAFKDEADVYVVSTNDSDLVMPMRMVSDDLHRATGLLSPMEPKRSSNELKQTNPSIHRQITVAALAACQLPDVINDGKGKVHRPSKWRLNSEGPDLSEPSNQ